MSFQRNLLIINQLFKQREEDLERETKFNISQAIGEVIDVMKPP